MTREWGALLQSPAPSHPLPLHLMLHLRLSLCRLAKVLWRYRDDDWIPAKHFLESLLGLRDSDHFNCKGCMLSRASSTLHAYAMLYVEQDVCLQTDEPGALGGWIIFLSFSWGNWNSKRWSTLPRGVRPVEGWRAELGLMLGLERPSGTFPTVSVCLVWSQSPHANHGPPFVHSAFYVPSHLSPTGVLWG